ncbi:osmoprotection protein (proV) [Methanocalculus chunghsingensis]|uniref:Molybdate/tungstate import ATP-binding protein WtpC n=1 Tax=Methanocalculus chunghsingensis TaxID=156457 RepID=A0A8J8B446_9EURY|nr:betaine/proline/choline family ABC transporter ATP-binding protein [Methanocalculus chunghsingensis]MBR1368935.1 osmoprotection protein (proV) [Methanocalculus chunghsingensis]
MDQGRPFERIDTITIRGITKRFGETVAVDDVSLEVQGGELLILIGGSGSGKTTTLRMINRLIDPDQGSISINGTAITSIDEIILRKNIGYVIQQIGLFPHMTVRENIGLVPKIEGWSHDRIEERVKELLTLVHLPPEIFMDRYPKELSGGQQQRIGLARALVMDPPLLLMDEPFGALDPLLRRQLQDEFIGIKEDIGRTIVFVTHDINEAFRLGDRIAIMHEGRIVQVGTARDLILSPADPMVAGLVGSDHLYRHLENLTVQDIMRPVSRVCLLQASTSISSAIVLMTDGGEEVAVISDGSSLSGVVWISDLLRGGRLSGTVGSYARSPPILRPDGTALSAISGMKADGDSIALVMNGEELLGIFTPDEVLRRLV